MKLLKNAAIAACLLGTFSAYSQQKSKVEHPKFTPPKIVRDDDPLVESKSRNKDVKNIQWKKDHLVKIEKLNGTVEIYDLSNVQTLKKFEEKYGVLPPAPPPPPKVLEVTPPPPLPPSTEKQ